MLAKTIITLEGTARSLNPKFSIGSVAEGFIKYYYINKVNLDNILTKTKDNTEELLFDIKNIPKQIKSILRNLENNNIKIQMEDIKFTSLERCIADLATNLSLSLVLASIIVGSSLIISSQNINQNVWIRLMAITGFFISFIIGLLLVIKIVRTQYRNRK
jgi:ubiquinone biosynthesis protein